MIFQRFSKHIRFSRGFPEVFHLAASQVPFQTSPHVPPGISAKLLAVSEEFRQGRQVAKGGLVHVHQKIL